MKIRKVIICGLGAVGLCYAGRLKEVCELKILADKERIERYEAKCPTLNGVPQRFDYITPEDKFFADLIIITTKNDGLDSAIRYIKNFVGENTTIISLLNGITSEEKIASVYGREKVLYSYFIGHSAVRDGNNVRQDGVGKIFFGSPYIENSNRVKFLKEFFDESGINYEIPKDITYSMWLKYVFNLYANQLSAVSGKTFGEMRGVDFINEAKKIISEAVKIAEKEGVKGVECLEKDALECLELMSPDGKTSMLQDIEAGRKTEVEIFAGEIIRRGKLHKIPTPANKAVYNRIKKIESLSCCL